MKIVYFTHSVMSCWKHGNAHFVRGVLKELRKAGHQVLACEPASGWSRANLLRDHGEEPIFAFRKIFPQIDVATYETREQAEALASDADVVIVHEWTEPALIAALGRRRARGAGFQLFFHDTYHRAVHNPDAARSVPIQNYDGVLACGESVAEVYRSFGWGSSAHVWHEAADTDLFRPPMEDARKEDIVWIGNWGDQQRTAELDEYLFQPAAAEGMKLMLHGARYPQEALDRINKLGFTYKGWLPNHLAPQVLARHICTVHVPSRFRAENPTGIATTRMFEAMACGIPLICGPWKDSEGLFRAGEDYLAAGSGAEMRSHLRLLLHDKQAREDLQRSALVRIRERHTCRHRALELLDIVSKTGGAAERRKFARQAFPSVPRSRGAGRVRTVAEYHEQVLER